LALADYLLRHAGRGLNPQADQRNQSSPSAAGTGSRPDPIRDQIPFLNVAFKGKDGLPPGFAPRGLRAQRDALGLVPRGLELVGIHRAHPVPSRGEAPPAVRRDFGLSRKMSSATSLGASRTGRPGPPRQAITHGTGADGDPGVTGGPAVLALTPERVAMLLSTAGYNLRVEDSDLPELVIRVDELERITAKIVDQALDIAKGVIESSLARFERENGPSSDGPRQILDRLINSRASRVTCG